MNGSDRDGILQCQVPEDVLLNLNQNPSQKMIVKISLGPGGLVCRVDLGLPGERLSEDNTAKKHLYQEPLLR